MNDWDFLRTLSGSFRWSVLVDILVNRHADLKTFERLSPSGWLERMKCEVAELEAALANQHEHPWELEACQIVSIAINMLRVHGVPLFVLKNLRKEDHDNQADAQETCDSGTP